MTTENIFFTSDHHFGHRGIIDYAGRPFDSVEEMDEAMIEAWNRVVGSNDIVFYLGDFSFRRGPDTDEILYRLNGRIRFILGNHDKGFSARGTARFEWIKPYYELKWDKKKPRMVLFHFPIDVWNKAHYGAIHLHGHSHGSLKTKRPRRMDVGVDTNPDLRPYALEEIVLRLGDESPEAFDHHKPRVS